MDPMNLIKVKQEDVQESLGHHHHHMNPSMEIPGPPPDLDHHHHHQHLDPQCYPMDHHPKMDTQVDPRMDQEMDQQRQAKMAAAPQLNINPWLVPWDEFLYYCCPECPEKSKDYDHFFAHAIQYHEQAKVAVGMSDQGQQYQSNHQVHAEIKEEVMDYEVDPSEALKTEMIDEDEDYEDEDYEEYDKPVVTKPRPLKEKLTKFQCYYCGALFDSSAEAKEHIEQVHNPDHGVNGFMFGKQLQYQCQDCKLMFKTEENLKLHICGTLPPTWTGIKMVGDTKFPCPKCDSEFVTYRRMLEHHAVNHTTEKKFKCSKCDYTSFTREPLERHEASHGEVVTCDICFKSLKNIKTLQRHKRVVHEGKRPTNPDKKCDVCDFTGESVTALRIHKEKMHPNAEPFKCDLCDYTSILKCRVRNHKSDVHKEKCNMCDICGRGFKSLPSLQKHVVRMHSNMSDHNPSHTCQECGKSFKNSTGLSSHILAVHNSSEKGPREYVCDQCGKDFLTKSHLAMHRYQIHGQKFFICTLCERIFSVRKKLAEHIKNDHEKRGLTKCIYCCDKCDNAFETSFALDQHLQNAHGMSCAHRCYEHECEKSFVTRALLTAHMIEVHNYNPMKDQSKTSFSSMTEVNAKTADKKFRCDYCGMYLKSEQTLSGHIISKHKTDTHNYKCDLCDFTTFQASRLKQHKIRTHTDWKKPKRVYECTECPRTFPAIGYMQTHLLDEHGIICKTD